MQQQQGDLASPSRWLASERRSRARRVEAARAAARRRLGHRGGMVMLATMALGAGGAAAATHGGAVAPAARVATVQGDVVKALQRALGLRADGEYGPRTRRAVKRFQRARGLVVDGIAGPATLAALGLAAPAAPPGVLARIAACESGGDPTAVSADGAYRGKYQFTLSTWESLGGEGDPVAAPEAEQDRRAAALYAREGTRPWPHCGRAAA